jgi:DNA-binding protein HU-beta
LSRKFLDKAVKTVYKYILRAIYPKFVYRYQEHNAAQWSEAVGLSLGGNVMNKTELVAAMAKEAELPKKDVEAALKAFIDVVSEELKNGGKIQLVGFGTFEVTERAAREGRNPQTGETMVIEASKAPKFKAGKALKDIVNS